MGTRRRTQPEVANPDVDDLLAFPRPSLAVDVAVLTVAPTGRGGADASTGEGLGLAVLLQRRSTGPGAGEWGLPGSFVRERERLTDAVLRTLADKCGIEGLAPRQIHVFDDPGRDDRGWVVSVAHVDVVPMTVLADVVAAREDLALASIVSGAATSAAARAPAARALVPDGPVALPFDHDDIVALAVGDLRDRYRSAPDPARLTPAPFTLLDLRRTHEAVLGEPLQKDTFRRQASPHLEEVEDVSRGTVGRPARLYRHAAGR